ncbi:MAG: DNA-processing protein DprA [Gammaproteobacteria bacterium]|nr:DNA-processing protein DprA [Gammaproteobacteria bacterium]
MSTNDWLILALAPGLRGVKFESLLTRFGSVSAIVNAGANELRSAELKQHTIDGITDPDERLLARCRDWLDHEDHHLVTRDAAAYPALLNDIYAAPTALFVRGQTDALTLPTLAIVGSRNATPGGADTAHRFAAHLGGGGFCIASGLALGIDAAAHAGALQGGGRTVAVCATGPDIVYPARHERLADEIAANGAVVTEFPPGTGVRREQFPQRNRLISGMSVGTLVIEAGLRSGALITARYASEQGREVFAVPGSIHNPTARGCHRLIRNGAKLVESSDDIIEELPGMLAAIGESVEQNDDRQAKNATTQRDPEYQRLLEFMGWDPVTVDVLVNRSGLTADEVSSMLLILELEGGVQPLFGGCYIQREEGRTK